MSCRSDVRDGMTVYCLGRPCRLAVTHSVWKRVTLTEDVLHVSLPSETDAARIQTLINDWLLEQARAVLPECFSEALTRYGWRIMKPRVPLVMRSIAQPGGVCLTVRRMKTRWGSCSVDGHITLNADLVHLPHRLIEYVAVHEFCHLAHHNHSPAFWFQVGTCLPDWRQRRAELKRWQSVIEGKSQPTSREPSHA